MATDDALGGDEVVEQVDEHRGIELPQSESERDALLQAVERVMADVESFGRMGVVRKDGVVTQVVDALLGPLDGRRIEIPYHRDNAQEYAREVQEKMAIWERLVALPTYVVVPDPAEPAAELALNLVQAWRVCHLASGSVRIEFSAIAKTSRKEQLPDPAYVEVAPPAAQATWDRCVDAWPIVRAVRVRRRMW